MKGNAAHRKSVKSASALSRDVSASEIDVQCAFFGTSLRAADQIAKAGGTVSYAGAVKGNADHRKGVKSASALSRDVSASDIDAERAFWSEARQSRERSARDAWLARCQESGRRQPAMQTVVPASQRQAVMQIPAAESLEVRTSAVESPDVRRAL